MIVGGGSGIGADTARKMSEMGYDVSVFSSSGRGEALGNELGGLGFTGSNLVVADLEAFVAATMDRFGRIDTVINCAYHPSDPANHAEPRQGIHRQHLNICSLRT